MAIKTFIKRFRKLKTFSTDEPSSPESVYTIVGAVAMLIVAIAISLAAAALIAVWMISCVPVS